MAEFTPEVKHDNRDPRVACALVLDTSSSMGGEPIAQLNEGFRVFCEEVGEDPLARKRTEVTVITFGGSVEVVLPFQEARDLVPVSFRAGGHTPMGKAVDLALDQLLARKQVYKEAGLEYYRPWLFVLTDGHPTDEGNFAAAARRVREVEAQRGATVFAIGVGDADMETLSALSAQREPARLQGLKFVELFQWLSASMSLVSQSGTQAPDDASAPDGGAPSQTALPPAGWANW